MIILQKNPCNNDNPKQEFYTLTGYQQREQPALTPAMEDYLEMICRLSIAEDPPCPVVRQREIAEKLHVRPASASKMTAQLKELGFINAEKYGYISLTAKGEENGRYLLFRHEVLQRFLCALNDSADELEQAEKLEHFLNPATVQNLWLLTQRLEAEKHLDKTPNHR